MLRKVVYLIAFCLSLLQTKAQNDSPKIIVSPSSNIFKTNVDSNKNKVSENSSSYTIKIIDGKTHANINTSTIELKSSKTGQINPKRNNIYVLYPHSNYSIKITAKGYELFKTDFIPGTKKLLIFSLKKGQNKVAADSSTKKTKTDTTLNKLDSSTINTNTIADTTNTIDTVAHIKTNTTPNKTDTSTNTKTDIISLFGVIFLVILTLVILMLTLKTRKDLNGAINKIASLPGLIKINRQNMEQSNNTATVSTTNDNTSVVKAAEFSPQANEISSAVAQEETTIKDPNAKAYFVCEIMMTAGPRKDDFEDIDLGEDVCGCVTKLNETMIWILDGTSDADRLWRRYNNLPPTDENVLLKDRNEKEYFSSRLLAQSIGNKLRKKFVEKNIEPSKEFIRQIINEVKEDWQKTITELSADDKKVLEETVKDKISINCSTTLLMAKLSIDGKLIAYRCGDSRMVLFVNTKEDKIALLEKRFEEKNEEKNDRLFFSLQLNKTDNSIGFFSNNDKLEPEIISEENINTLISFSDGIGVKTQQYLKEEYKNNPDIAKNEIINQRQGTQDDKSICFVEIKQNS